ncbi:protein indeterminate-domain 12 [Cynara cardunculus var. scolymus]|uniref:Zinc finger, C2H2 n=1 Tax=Cynara cardunculus var. scolymus TaxID=59895 RepID=A0A103YM96_CYNCS|nr:protein indeterminate-domain 12 [Cynara cardunculus var. scolymus]KVI11617.1 Zinc finger, C2H2 [Cynara cardunculus var. scolymus]
MMFSASVYSTTSNKNSTSLSEEAATSTVSSVITSKIPHEFTPSMTLSSISNLAHQEHDLYPNHQKIKKKRNLPGNPDPDAEVIALSPKTLMATNRFVCEICNKGFQRDQNLQLHRRGHNLPWKLKQRNNKDEMKKRAYVCPEPSCVHHHPSRALGDLTGIKKHFCRKHGEKKWKCDKCSKIYAVQSDWKAHSKTCGTREYRCDCGTLFSRKDSFITHRAFCDALAEETARLSAAAAAAAAAVSITNNHHPSITNNVTQTPFNIQQNIQNPSSSLFPFTPTLNATWVPTQTLNPTRIKPETIHHQHLLPAITTPFYQEPNKEQLRMITSPPATTFHGLHVSTSRDHVPAAHHLSATALLQKAATVGAVGDHVGSTMSRLDMGELVQVTTTAAVISPEYHQHMGLTSGNIATWQKTDRLTRDFLGLTGDQEDDHHHHGGGADVNVSVNMRNMLTYTGGIEIPTHGFGFAEPTTASEAWGNC